MAKGTNIKIQEAQRTPLKIKKNRSKSQNLIVKFTSLSDKEKTLKAARVRKSVTYNGKNISWRRVIHRDLAGQKEPA